jgi:hypothetical protein
VVSLENNIGDGGAAVLEEMLQGNISITSMGIVGTLFCPLRVSQ